MNFLQKLFLERVKNTREDILLISLKNCHLKGLDSVVLDKDRNGCLTRVFFAHKKHVMWKNHPQYFNATSAKDRCLSLGAHDHLYDLRLLHLYGEAFNYTVKPTLHEKGFHVYEYDSSITGSGKVKRGAPCGLKLVKQEIIKDTYIPHNAIHTVYVPFGKKSAWIVQEGDKQKDKNRLISHLKIDNIDSTGLYQKFQSKEEIVSMVEEFLVD